MRAVRTGFEFRMELAGDKPRVIDNFNHLYYTLIRRKSGKDDSMFFKLLTKFIIDFISVAVTLIDQMFTIYPV